MNNYTVDLTNCDKEPIHIPGKVQSHGFLIAIDSTDFHASYVSDNILSFFGATAKEILLMTSDELNLFLSVNTSHTDFHQLLQLGISQDSFNIINPYKFTLRNDPFYLIIHLCDNNFILEFEPATLEYDIQNLLGKSISEVLSTKTLSGLLKNAAREIKALIGYDRVMIYKFHDDGHGEVVAEKKNENLEPFLGLHYPSSDIPKQARDLYKINFTRIIADVSAKDSSISTSKDHLPLNLTYSSLRAVSPIHIQYLVNMGVESSFSISLLSKGELWGLVACHNYSPKFIDYRAREGAKLIGQILSSALEFRQSDEETSTDVKLQEAVQKLSANLDNDNNFLNALTGGSVTLLDITQAVGAAIFFEGSFHKVGITPDEPELNDLFTWLKRTMTDSIYHTSQLPEIYKPAKAYASVASGILACMLYKDMGELVVWFKPEIITTINWAGNPDKPVEIGDDGGMVLTPRHSFEAWAEIVKYNSERWKPAEISGVLKIREKMISTINKKANEIRLLNERLKLAYEELDTFSYTISHDLRTPLTSIKSFTELFLVQNKNLDDKGRNLLNRVVAGADKMSFLINEILKLARVGRSEVDMVNLDMPALIEEVNIEVVASLKANHVQIDTGNCPPIKGDKTLISQVFTNLISNAVKYSSKTARPEVFIEGYNDGENVVYKIKDNGIGIDVNYHDKVFELFKRMENVKDFEGTGVGLAIVKRIMERHNGRIWFESELGQGTVFYISFKN